MRYRVRSRRQSAARELAKRIERLETWFVMGLLAFVGLLGTALTAVVVAAVPP